MLKVSASYKYPIASWHHSGRAWSRKKHILLGRLLKAWKIPEGSDSAELFALILTASNLLKISDHLLHILRPRHGQLPTRCCHFLSFWPFPPSSSELLLGVDKCKQLLRGERYTVDKTVDILLPLTMNWLCVSYWYTVSDHWIGADKRKQGQPPATIFFF